MSPGFDPILFDLDGTIIDSLALIRESYRHAARTVLGRELTEDELARQMGRALEEGMREISVEHEAALITAYRSWNVEHTTDHLAVFPGVESMLERLRAAGRSVGLVTSKSGATLDVAFDVVPIERCFMVAVAADDTLRHKPDPEPIVAALARLGMPATRACYVGDGRVDMMAAAAAGVTAVGVAWGFSSRDVLTDAGAHHVVDDVAGLERLLLGR